MPLPERSAIRAAADTYRNRIKDFDDHLMLSLAGLWNFYLQVA